MHNLSLSSPCLTRLISVSQSCLGRACAGVPTRSITACTTPARSAGQPALGGGTTPSTAAVSGSAVRARSHDRAWGRVRVHVRSAVALWSDSRPPRTRNATSAISANESGLDQADVAASMSDQSQQHDRGWFSRDPTHVIQDVVHPRFDVWYG